jgi:hypothetical protein
MKKIYIATMLITAIATLGIVPKHNQAQPQNNIPTNSVDTSEPKLVAQYSAAIHYADAAINSLAALNGLIKKENYRNKISSFNNPTSSDMGFNLQLEINTALKPLLEKCKHTNPNRFTEVVGSLVGSQNKNGLAKNLLPSVGVFSTLTSLVGNLAVNEKRITKTDVDSFIINISKYFGQYEKLNRINQQFDVSIDKTDIRLQELQTDLKDFIIDLVMASNSSVQRNSLKQKLLEEMLLKDLDELAIKNQILVQIEDNENKEDRKKPKRNKPKKQKNGEEEQDKKEANVEEIYFPADAIKTAKDINSTLNKIFAEYQKVYTNNYNDIKSILQETKQLGKNINVQQIDNSLTELQKLYNESKTADAITLRLSTLAERLKLLVATEKMK